MTKTKGIAALILSFALALSLTACGKPTVSASTDNAKDLPGASVSEETSTEASIPETPSVEEPEPVAENDEDVFIYKTIESEEQLINMLIGEWTYCPYLTNSYSGCYITFNSDMTYEINSDEGDQKGEWRLDKLDPEDDSLYTELIVLRAYEGGNLSEFGGDYLIDAAMVDEGALYMRLLQANNGDSVFSTVYDSYAPLLLKNEPEYDHPDPAAPANVSFDGILWYINYNDASEKYIISAYDENTIIGKAYTCNICSYREFVNPPEDYDAGNIYRVKVTTDDKGQIVVLDYYKGFMGGGVTNIKHIDSYLTGYSVETKDYSYSDKFYIEARTSLPHFIEDNEYAVKLNKLMEKVDKEYSTETVPEMNIYAEEMADILEAGESYSYCPLGTYSVYWQYYGEVSICLYWYWNMGGVYNMGYKCFNYDPITDKEISLSEHLGMSDTEVKTVIKNAFREQYAGVIDDFGVDLDATIDPMTDFKYYVNDDGVFVVFDSYEMNMGTSSAEVQIIEY